MKVQSTVLLAKFACNNFAHLLGSRNHHVHFYVFVASEVWPKRAHDWVTEREVRHEVAVHYVEMESVGTRAEQSVALIGEIGQIRVENARGYQWKRRVQSACIGHRSISHLLETKIYLIN